jgi:hypothetical protein
MGIVKLSKAGFKSSTYEKYNDFLAGNPSYVPPSYDSIATVIVGSGGAADVTFSSISSTYTDLQIRVIGRGTQSSASTYLQIQFNGDTAANYYGGHWLTGNGTSATAGADGAASVIYAERLTAANATASIFGVNIIDILDYKSTSKFKTTRNLGGYDANGSGQITFSSGLWRSTAAISSIKITPAASDFAQYTKIALYGIKG